MNRIIDHLYIFLTIIFATYSQLIMRWQVGNAGTLPEDINGKIHFVITLLLKPWVISSLVATFLSGVAWMLAISRLDISYAYPFTALTFIFIVAGGHILFNEPASIGKLLGSILVLSGLLVISKTG